MKSVHSGIVSGACCDGGYASGCFLDVNIYEACVVSIFKRGNGDLVGEGTDCNTSIWVIVGLKNVHQACYKRHR